MVYDKEGPLLFTVTPLILTTTKTSLAAMHFGGSMSCRLESLISSISPSFLRTRKIADGFVEFPLEVVRDFRGSISLDSAGRPYMQTRRYHGLTDQREFDRLLVESLDESVAMILGEIAKKVVYEILEKNYALAVNRIPERLNEFTSAFERIFGAASSKTMGRVIVKRLYSKLGLTFVEISDWRLLDYVKEARARITLYDDLAERP